MPNYKEIARLKAAGQSNRAIADFLGLSRNTVNASVARIEDSGLWFEDLQILTDAQINEVFPLRPTALMCATIWNIYSRLCRQRNGEKIRRSSTV